MTNLAPAEKQFFVDLGIDISALPAATIDELYPEKVLYPSLRETLIFYSWAFMVDPVASRLIVLINSYINGAPEDAGLDYLRKLDLLESTGNYRKLQRMSEQASSYSSAGISGAPSIPVNGGTLDKFEKAVSHVLSMISENAAGFVEHFDVNYEMNSNKTASYLYSILEGAIWAIVFPQIALNDDEEIVSDACLPAEREAMALLHSLEQAFGVPYSEHQPFPELSFSY